MTARAVHVGMWLDGRDLDLAATAVQLAVNVTSKSPDASPVSRELRQLLKTMRAACSMTCAAQVPQVAESASSSEWMPTDLITVREAAELLSTSESNIRQRLTCKRPSLWGFKSAGRWLLSRSDVCAHAARRKAS